MAFLIGSIVGVFLWVLLCGAIVSVIYRKVKKEFKPKDLTNIYIIVFVVTMLLYFIGGNLNAINFIFVIVDCFVLRMFYNHLISRPEGYRGIKYDKDEFELEELP